MTDELGHVATAQELARGFAARATEGEQLRRLPEASVTELRDSGLLELLVPKRWGGDEGDIVTLAEVGRELAHGCMSSAWVGTFFMLHGWVLALFPEEAQAEVFAAGPVATAAGPFAPNGRAVRVDDGYRLTGTWSWGTGIMHSDWALVGGVVEGDDTLDALSLFLVPIGDVAVHDVWHTSGMRATGSNDVVITDAPVPAHRRIPFLSLVEGITPGAQVHDTSLYRWPMVPILAIGAAVPALGTAERVVDDFRERLGERVLAYTGERQGQKPAAQMRLAQATVRVDAVRALLRATVADLTRSVEGGHVDRSQRAHARLVAAHVVHESRLVVQSLCEASGGSVHALSSPFQRALRDVNTAAGHVIFDYDSTTELAGAMAIGAEVPITALI